MPVVLGIETSCDETGVAVVSDSVQILSNVVATQTHLHERFGGVVPEIAARAHIEVLPECVRQALDEAGVSPGDLDGIAATRGPGLIGALVVGFAWGKAMASTLGAPFIGVHHLEGHIFSGQLSEPDLELPFVALVVSGGHTALYGVRRAGHYALLGSTLDDAAGEAFDKTARLLGLGYPGGPAIDRLAMQGDGSAVRFPRAMRGRGLDFSYSGLKTAVVNHMRAHPDANVADIAASFQEAATDVLVEKAMLAVEGERVGTLVVGGGVTANTVLRAKLTAQAQLRGIRLVIPPMALCVDNGAMIAAAGSFRLSIGERTPLEASADPRLHLPN